ncbi:hypothetical protein [Streptomyces sp. NPDC006324]|uniref:hypothetical protein n=1 Tax=Streptomyces sp. NPDC006324 TaxID=3156751 RepID=UPI0033BD34BC
MTAVNERELGTMRIGNAPLVFLKVPQDTERDGRTDVERRESTVVLLAQDVRGQSGCR